MNMLEQLLDPSQILSVLGAMLVLVVLLAAAAAIVLVLVVKLAIVSLPPAIFLTWVKMKLDELFYQAMLESMGTLPTYIDY